MSGVLLLFKILKPFKTFRKLPYFKQNQLCPCLIHALIYKFAYNFEETIKSRTSLGLAKFAHGLDLEV